MKFYCIADTHGFLKETKQALSDAGYFTDKDPHKLIILGDILDRGKETKEMVEFVLEEMDKGGVILIKGNHEDLLLDLINRFPYWMNQGIFRTHHYRNGTYKTACDLANMDIFSPGWRHYELVDKLKEHPFITKVIPSMQDFFETKNYLFVHGWVPVEFVNDKYVIEENFRTSPNWSDARWLNGMKFHHDGVYLKDKTIVCGHFHASFGHSTYENDGPQFGAGANYNPYIKDGIMAIDAATVYSKKVNCVIIEDEEL